MAQSKQSKELTVAELADRDLERWSDRELRELTDYEQAIQAAIGVYGKADDVTEEIGNGFAVLSKDDKAKLVGKPFFALYWTFNAGDFGDYFVSAACITPEGMKFILNDGSSGIYQQLADYSTTHDGKQGALMCPGGLRSSTYPTCPGCQRPRPKQTVECTNLLHNGTVCGDTSEDRETGTTFYLETARQPS